MLKKKDPVGIILYGFILEIGSIIGIMIISQTVIQMISGIEMTIGVFLGKILSFVVLSVVAIVFHHRLYKNMEE